jgi:hypothetical protein
MTTASVYLENLELKLEKHYSFIIVYKLVSIFLQVAINN